MPAFSESFDLSTLDGVNGFRLDGIDAGDRAGRSVSSAGDVNDDGFGDIIIGADRADPGANLAGESYVVFGSGDGFAPSIALASLDGANGFRLDGGGSYHFSGRSAAGAGDINGDGFDDVVVGAYGFTNYGYAGRSYVVFGKAGGFAADLDLEALDGSNGFFLSGLNNGDVNGISVDSAGDVNGDGIDDLFIGARGGDPGGVSSAGESYVVFGTTAGFAASFDLAALDGANGFRIDGTDGRGFSGEPVASAGDVNGDGFGDLIIGATGEDAPGESFVVFGRAGGFAPSLSLGTLDGTNGFRLGGLEFDDYSGRSVASAGDMNGDGFDEIVIGANGADPGGRSFAGESYVVFGKADGFTADFDLAGLDGANGFRVEGIDAFDFSGWSTASAGDVDADGFDDLLIGAPTADADGLSSAGETYVLFGKAGGFTASFDLTSLDGSNGFRIDGIASADLSGGAVAGAGDVNGDGIDDILVGGYGADPNGASGAGASYVVYGRLPTEAVARIGSEADQTIRGGDLNDTLNGKLGDDSLVGGSGDDVLRGTAGNDTMVGGEGGDMYFVETAGDVVIELAGEGTDMVIARTDFSAGVNEVEIIRSKGSAGLALTGGDNATRIRGGAGDDTLAGGAAGDVITGAGGDDRILASSGGDFVKGGGGADSFVLSSEANGADRVRIADFTSGEDVIELDADDFGGGLTPGALAEDAFVANSSGVAEDAEDRLIYNSFSGVLSFDADGTGEGEATDIARLMRSPTIDASDFLVTGAAAEAPSAAMFEGAADRWWGSLHEMTPGLSQIA